MISAVVGVEPDGAGGERRPGGGTGGEHRAAPPGPTRTPPASAGRGLIPEPAPRPTAAVRVQSRFAEKVKQIQVFGGVEYLARGDFYNSPGIRVGATYYPIESLGPGAAGLPLLELARRRGGAREGTFGALPDSHAPGWLALLGGRYSIGYGKLMVGGLGAAIHFEPQAFAHFGVHDHDGDVGPSGDAGLGFLVFLTPAPVHANRRRQSSSSASRRSGTDVSVWGVLPSFSFGGTL